QAVRPGHADPSGEERLDGHSGVHSEAAPRRPGDILALDLGGAPYRPRAADRPPETDGDLGLRRREIRGEKRVAVVALLAPPAAEGTVGHPEAAPPPARQREGE